MCVTKTYAFRPEQIGKMCPCELKPYEDAYRLEQEQIDIQNHILGKYVCMSIMSTIGNSQWFKDKHTPPFEYPETAFLQQETETTEKRKNGYKESNEEIAVFEMRKRINLLKKQGLPESPS